MKGGTFPALKQRDISEANAHRMRQQRGPVPTHKVTLTYKCPTCQKQYHIAQPWSKHMPSPVQTPTLICVLCDDTPTLELSMVKREELSDITVPLIVPPSDLRSA